MKSVKSVVAVALIASLSAWTQLSVAQGKDTIAGIDADNNGIRDDIQVEIEKRHPNDEIKRQILNQKARAIQKAVIAGAKGNSSEIFEAADDLMSVVDCQFDLLDDPMSLKSSFIEFMTINTKERSNAYIDFNQALDGNFFGVNTRDDPCE